MSDTLSVTQHRERMAAARAAIDTTLGDSLLPDLIRTTSGETLASASATRAVVEAFLESYQRRVAETELILADASARIRRAHEALTMWRPADAPEMTFAEVLARHHVYGAPKTIRATRQPDGSLRGEVLCSDDAQPV